MDLYFLLMLIRGRSEEFIKSIQYFNEIDFCSFWSENIWEVLDISRCR